MRIEKARLMRALLSCSFVILSFACSESSKKQQELEKLCTDEEKLSALITEVINVPEFQDYLRVQETLKQRELVIIENKIVTKSLDIVKFDLPVRFLNADQISKEKIKAFVEIKKVDISPDTAKVHFTYDVQGVGSICKLIPRENCGWTVVSVQLREN